MSGPASISAKITEKITLIYHGLINDKNMDWRQRQRFRQMATRLDKDKKRIAKFEIREIGGKKVLFGEFPRKVGHNTTPRTSNYIRVPVCHEERYVFIVFVYIF
jgi:hypothetical protein